MSLDRLRQIVLLRFRSLIRRDRVENDLDEELQFHLENQIRDNLARGMAPAEARRQALLQFGGLEQRKEDCRDMRRVRTLDDLHKDVAFAARTLRRSPGFAIASIATIALGIAAGTTVFSVTNAVLLRPLPYRDPDRLLLVLRETPGNSVGPSASRNFLYSNADFIDLQRGTREIFEEIGGIAPFRAFVPLKDGTIEQASKALVTENFFRLLGARVILGRDFTEADAAPATTRPRDLLPAGTAAILSYAYWQRRFGGNPGILGQEMPGAAPGGPRIVGVLAPEVRLYFGSRSWVDAEPDFFIANNAGYDSVHRNLLLVGAIARLKPGLTLEHAQDRVHAISKEVLRTTFDPNAVLRLESMRSHLVKEVRPAIVALMGSVVFLMLIACANMANLLLVRSGQRERELAVRAALGGSAGRLMRQMLTEALLLSAAGTLTGIALSWLGIRIFLRLAPANLPRIESTSLDWRVLTFAAASGVTAAAIFGGLPAWKAIRPNILEILRGSGRGSSLAPGAMLRNGVVVAEVTLSFVLLIGSGLMLRSFLALQNVNPGFQSHGLLTFFVTRDWPLTRQDGRLALLRQIQTQLQSLPGIESATASLHMPLTQGSRAEHPPSAQPRHPRATSEGADFQQVSPGYFETLHTPILAGRTFTEQDNAPGRNVVIIDQELARAAFPGEDPVGKPIAVPFPDMPEAQVIGVAASQRSSSLADPPHAAIYFPEGAVGIGVSRSWAIRTAGDPAAYASAVRTTLARIDPRLVVSKFRTMNELVSADQSGTRFSLLLIGFFACISATLAAIGIYGVLAAAVGRRTAEIGIRIALGASTWRIFSTVIAKGLALTCAGLAIGLVAAWMLTRAISSLLVEVAPTDPATFALITALFLLIAALSSWLPARRAARLDPSEALRAE